MKWGESFEPVTPGDLCRGSNTHTTARNYNRGHSPGSHFGLVISVISPGES